MAIDGRDEVDGAVSGTPDGGESGVPVRSASGASDAGGSAGVDPGARGSGSAPAGEPSFADRVRTLLHTGRAGMLATWSRRHPGHPFGSLAPYGVLADGSPTLLLSRLAVHAQNLAADPRASLLVAPDPGDLAAPRVTLVGGVARVSDETLEDARADYLARHESARAWVGFGDFAFHRLDVAAAYYVAGFGAMGWVEGEELRAAAPDPLADSAPAILAHMNADHRDALVLYCRCFAGVTAGEAEMTAVDRLGFAVRVRTADGERSLRIAFSQPVATPDDTRKALVAMVREARAKLGVA
jgi:putative heme iron utilization protein